MKIESFTTSWGSQIAPCILKRVIKRIQNKESAKQIIVEEIRDLVDSHPNSEDEMNEIFDYCEDVFYDHQQQNANN